MALFRNFGRQSGCGRDKSGIACAAYSGMPPRNAADFLELAKNGVFWIGNLSVPFMKPRMDTNYKKNHGGNGVFS
jgi:hypothetical protein